MSISGSFSIKEAVEAIETRMPFGKLVVKALLTLTAFAVMTWICRYLIHDFFVPIVASVPHGLQAAVKSNCELVISLILSLLSLQEESFGD